jgi:hypothetical protein
MWQRVLALVEKRSPQRFPYNIMGNPRTPCVIDTTPDLVQLLGEVHALHVCPRRQPAWGRHGRGFKRGVETLDNGQNRVRWASPRGQKREGVG